MDVVFFYVFVALTLGLGLVVALSTNLLHSAFALFGVLFGVAGFYVLLSGDFLAMVQIMVYAGGINVLLIFGTMITADVDTPKISNVSVHGGLTFVASVGMMVLLYSVLSGAEWNTIQNPIYEPTTLELGRLLLKDYVLPFEVISFLLLSAMVGSLMLVMKGDSK